MPKIKKQCRMDFTTIHNAMVQDRKLGATERGVLLTMLSLPEDWNFSIKGLSSILPDGEHKIGTALKKIEERGYLKRERIQSKENGRFADWVYTFSDEPIFLNEKTSVAEYADSEAENRTDNDTVYNQSEEPHSENRNMEENELPQCGFPDVDNPVVENRNDNKINNNKINNNILTNLSISHSSNNKYKIHIGQKNDVIDEMDYNAAIEVVKKQLSPERICTHCNREQVDEIVDLVAWTYITPQAQISISGVLTDTSLVRKRFAQLDSGHIEYVLDCLNNTTTKIKNRRSYLLTCLFSAPVTIDGYYANQVAHDFASS